MSSSVVAESRSKTTSFVKHPLREIMPQLLRFCVVGGLNTFIDVLVFNLLIWRFATQDTSTLVFYNSIAYLVGAVNSFCFNKLWTFEHRSRVTREQVIRFLLVTVLGIICNDGLLGLATSLLNNFAIYGFLWTNLAKVSAIAGTFAISYIGMRFSVFTKSTQELKQIPLSANPHLFVRPRSLSVILPAYNEEEVIGHTIIKIMTTLTQWMNDFEVIVVNDGSKDRTQEIVSRFSAYDSRVRLINHPVNKGYGAALVTGFEAIRKETAFFMDSDGQFDIHDLARFFPLIEDYDAVLGYRIDRQDTWMRKLNAWGWKQLVKFVFGVNVRDIDCAFKLYRSEFFHSHKLETRGAMINAEILYKLARAGYIYTEVGVQHLPRQGGQATGAKITVILRALRELFVYARKWGKEETDALPK
jgi:putative flippase GtrA